MKNQRAEFMKHHTDQHPLREGLPPLPERMRYLRRDTRGYPVPWFVAWIDGKPDFRVVRAGGIPTAYQKKLCWICGQPLGLNLAFVIGPMCAVNRVTSEPPSHLECATFAVQACPFMVLPSAKRRDANLPADTKPAAGIPIERNPGVVVLWVTTSYRPFKVPNGYLFELGSPNMAGSPQKGEPLTYDVQWWTGGKRATREESYASIRSGMPALIEMAKKDGAVAIGQLTRQYQSALWLLPLGGPVTGLDVLASEPPSGTILGAD